MLQFVHGWQQTFLGMTKENTPSEGIMEPMYRKRVDKDFTPGIVQALALHDQGTAHKGESKSYKMLKTIVTVELDRRRIKKLRLDKSAGGKKHMLTPPKRAKQ